MPAPKLEQFLSKTEAEQLRRMAEHSPEWIYLLKLLDSLAQVATAELVTFRTNDEAWQRKGFARGVNLVREVIRNLYDTRIEGANHVGTSDTSASPSTSSLDSTGYATSDVPSGPAY
jgi:hypothetical protein